jgi:hypothetical protein
MFIFCKQNRLHWDNMCNDTVSLSLSLSPVFCPHRHSPLLQGRQVSAPPRTVALCRSMCILSVECCYRSSLSVVTFAWPWVPAPGSDWLNPANNAAVRGQRLHSFLGWPVRYWYPALFTNISKKKSGKGEHKVAIKWGYSLVAIFLANILSDQKNKL